MGNPYAPPGDQSSGPGEPSGAPHRDPSARPTGPAGAPAGGDGASGPHEQPPHEQSPPGAGPPSGGSTPPGTPPSPAQVEANRAASRRALRFYAFLIAGLLTMPLPVPWQAASLLFVLGAIGVGVHGFVQAWRGGVRGATLAALGVMTFVAGLVALMMLSLLAVWPEQLVRQRCLAEAVTISATRQCDADFEDAVQQRLGGIDGTGDTTQS